MKLHPQNSNEFILDSVNGDSHGEYSYVICVHEFNGQCIVHAYEKCGIK